MNDQIFSFGEDGAKFTVYVALDLQTSLILAASLFGALMLALFIYKQI